MRYTPDHASEALTIVVGLLPRVSPRTEYRELVEVLRQPARWHEAHALFNKIRVNITLPTESHRNFDLDSLFIYVAENAAKTAYNCSGRSALFDADSFDRLLRCQQQFLDAEKGAKQR
jgi:hypothetical protein